MKRRAEPQRDDEAVTREALHDLFMTRHLSVLSAEWNSLSEKL